MNRKYFAFPFLLVAFTLNAQKLTSFREQNKYGLKDAAGKIIIPAKYNSVVSYDDGYVIVELNGKYGYIDQSGNEIIAPAYEAVLPFSDGLAAVKLNGLWGYIDRTGKIVIPAKYQTASNFSNGNTSVWVNGKSFLIDKTGKSLTSQKYDGAESFYEGLSKVFIGKYPNTKYGFVDLSGKEIVPLIYDGAESFSEGLAVVKQHNKWGFIDKTGKQIIPLQYDHAGNFREGLSPVNMGGVIDKDGFFNGGKSGFIDKTGKLVIPMQYDKAKTFTKQGLAPVLLNGKWGVIEKTGTAVTGMNYSELEAYRLSLSDELKNKYNKTKPSTAQVQQNTRVNTTTETLKGGSLKELTSTFSKTYNYQREWAGNHSVGGEPTSEKKVGNVTFRVNADEIKVYTGGENLADTHTIQASRNSSHPEYGTGKLYTAKSKKYNTFAVFFFFDNEKYGVLITWIGISTQYVFIF